MILFFSPKERCHIEGATNECARNKTNVYYFIMYDIVCC